MMDWIIFLGEGLLVSLPFIFGTDDGSVKAKRNRMIADEYKKRYKDKK